jgi:2-amino-4-hydroxy-6-hydroxymethyldihydropteridine diphosphokinase
MSLVYLSLGSNIGNRDHYLEEARRAFLKEFSDARFSKIYETEPVEFRNQPWFLNQVVELKTDWAPETLLEWGQALEKRMGRQRDIAKGPRTLDVDILLFGEKVSLEPKLTLPHPRLSQRRHVLEPLFELAPGLVLPGGVPLREALETTKDSSQVKLHAQP